MIHLSLSHEPFQVDLGHDVRLRVMPLTTSLMAAARTDPLILELKEKSTAPDVLAVAIAKVLARLAVLDWEGVSAPSGAPLPVTPEGLDALLDIPVFFEAFQARYLSKGLLLEEEKKDCAPSQNGNLAGVPNIVEIAKESAPNVQQS